MVDSPGRILSDTRKARGGSLQEYAEKTKIPVSSLEALEADNWSWMAAPIYVKGFLRAYARELDLDPEPLLAAWRKASSQGGVMPSADTVSARALDAPNPSLRWAAGIALGAIVFVLWLVLNSGLSPREDAAVDSEVKLAPVTTEETRTRTE